MIIGIAQKDVIAIHATFSRYVSDMNYTATRALQTYTFESKQPSEGKTINRDDRTINSLYQLAAKWEKNQEKDHQRNQWTVEE